MSPAAYNQLRTLQLTSNSTTLIPKCSNSIVCNAAMASLKYSWILANGRFFLITTLF